jgi:carbon-monoxide dehydrogenase large subunit
MGLKGAGESGTTGAAAAIANAVADALRDLDIDITSTPITPASLRAHIVAAGGQRTSSEEST